MIYSIRTQSVIDTISFGELLGSRLRGGEVFELVSDLGGGKTALVHGLAKGAGSVDEVSSPSFTINNTYSSSRLTIEHFDFYRLEDAGVLARQLVEDISRSNTVVVVEWADTVRGVLPKNTITIRITAESDTARSIECTYPQMYGYVFDSGRVSTPLKDEHVGAAHVSEMYSSLPPTHGPILAVRTDTERAWIGIVDRGRVVVEHEWIAGRTLATTLLEQIDRLLHVAHVGYPDLVAIACFLGPGSYTGLRIGIATANAIAYSHGLPIGGGMGDNWLADAMAGALSAGVYPRQLVPEYGGNAHVTL